MTRKLPPRSVGATISCRSPYYPHPGAAIDSTALIASGVLLLAVTGLIICYGARFPYLFVGWFWYVGTLVPVIGLVQVGSQGMADRYTYVPLIGVFLAAVWGGADLVARWSIRTEIMRLVTGGLMLICAAYTWGQVQVWHSDETLWEHALQVTQKNILAHNNLALALVQRGQMADAIHHYDAALAIDPNDWELHNNLGIALARAGDHQGALAHFREAVRLNLSEKDTTARKNLANAVAVAGAIHQFEAALAIDPNNSDAHNDLGCVLATTGDLSGALAHFREAVRLNPAHAKAQINLERALSEIGPEDQNAASK